MRGPLRAWRVDPGGRPVVVRYEVLEEDREGFSLRMCVTTEEGKKIYSRVTFSPDRQEMHNTTRVDLGAGLSDDIARTVRSQLGGASNETVYRRVDDKTSP